MKEGLNIFVDAHCFDDGHQGSRTFIKGLYAELALSEGLNIYLGAHDVGKLRKEFPAIPAQNFIRYRSRNIIIRLGFEIPRILKKKKIDFAHFQYVAPVIKYCKYMVTTHDILFKDYKQAFPWYYPVIRNAIFKRSLQKADVKSTPSAYSRERISFHYKIPSREIHLVPNGVHSSFFPSDGDKIKSVDTIRSTYGVNNFILCVNRIEPRKNQALLLQSFLDLELYKQGMSLVFIGETSLRYPEFNKKWHQLSPHMQCHIRYYPQISQEDLIHFYQAARLLVYPSKAEGFGIPPLEAAALKVPVLCANTTAMAEYFFFKKNLFDPANEREFKEKLSRILSDPQDSEELAKISAFIRENYSWKKSGQKLLALIGQQTQGFTAF